MIVQSVHKREEKEHHADSSHESDSDEESKPCEGRHTDQGRKRRQNTDSAGSKGGREVARHIAKPHTSSMRQMYSGINPSTTSVYTTLTTKSGSTNSTITQESYNRKVNEARRSTSADGTKDNFHDTPGPSNETDGPPRVPLRNAPIVEEENDGQQRPYPDEMGSEGSSSEEGEAMSSHSPATQSSGSTFPSSTDAQHFGKSVRLGHVPVDSHSLRPRMRSNRMIRSGFEDSDHSSPDVHPAEVAVSTSLSPSPSPLPAAPDAPHISETTTTLGYESLAAAIIDPSKPGKPIYRKFDELNHRVLLHLQDELAELEESLQYWDRRIARETPRTSDGKPLPSSRRAEAWAPGDHPHYQRRYLLGCIYVKTEQYNKALESFCRLGSMMERPDTESIKGYKSFLESEECIHRSEARFLDRHDDLIIVPSRRVDKSTDGARNVQDWTYNRLKTEHPFLVLLFVCLVLPVLISWVTMMITILRR